MPTSDVTALAVVVVSWNVRELVLACLESVFADVGRGGIVAQVWLVDNASHDNTLEAVRARFPECHLVASDKNLGFAGGNNAALRAMGFPDGEEIALPEAVLLLNPDTLVRPGALRQLAGIIVSRPEAGIVGARLVYADGSFQHGAFAFPGLWQLAMDLFPFPARLRESRLNGRYPRAWYAGEQPFEIDHPLGAAMMVRREAIREVGLLDEGYHLYGEEIDWALRIKAAGWRAYCVPGAEIVHYGGQSTGQARAQSVIDLWASRLRLYLKHYGWLKRWMALIILRAGINRRLRRVARDSSLGEDAQRALVAAYLKVLRMSRGGA